MGKETGGIEREEEEGKEKPERRAKMVNYIYFFDI